MVSRHRQLTTKLARWLYALPLAGFGATHLLMGSELEGYVPTFLPGGVLWVYVTGVGFIAACLSFVTERRSRLAGLLLAAMFLTFALTVDIPRLLAADGRDAVLGVLTNLGIDVAFAGSALLLADRYSMGEDLIHE